MQHPIHPDDERLAALAGADPEVTSDAALRAHVDSCDRCGPMVHELAQLRTALGELPDLVPSRPLQLLPPVPEVRRAVAGGWLRRLAGPAMAAGFVLVVVGAIGSSGVNLNVGFSGAAAQSMAEAGGNDSTTGQPVTEPGPFPNGGSAPSSRAYASGEETYGSVDHLRSGSPKEQEGMPPADQGSTPPALVNSSDPRLPWLLLLGLGVGLLLAGIFLRFAQQPRAG